VRNNAPSEFVSDPNRDACSSIRGYLYQVDCTILRWATLERSQALELEQGEDIDIIATAVLTKSAERRVLEQLKYTDRTLTLRSAAALESLARFCEHRRANKNAPGKLFFRFTTTALPGKEKPPGPLPSAPGILLWEELRRSGSARPDAIRGILRFLQKVERPQNVSIKLWNGFRKFLNDRDSDFGDFIQSFEWAAGAPDSEDVRSQVRQLLQLQYGLENESEAEAKYDELTVFILRLLARKPTHDRRRLTRRSFDRQITRTGASASIKKLAAEMHAFRASLADDIATANTRLKRIDESTQELLRHAGSGDAPRLEKVAGPAVILKTFGDISEELISWPQETNGHWIDRAGFRELQAQLGSPNPTFAVLLGEAGSGKSAALARLALTLRKSGVAHLALKIDKLPKEVKTLKELDERWFPRCGLVDGVRKIAGKRPITILIDQLDALASLMDQQTSRLEVVIELIRELRHIPNVHIILSCREFDFKYDSRLRAIPALQVKLDDLVWADIEPILREAGFDPTGWPEASRKIFSKPQHLNFFLGSFASTPEIPAFETYQAMLEAVFNERVVKQLGESAVQVCLAIASTMASRGEIWLPALEFSQHQHQIDRLAAAAILKLDKRLIGFTHQTLFDYVRTRSFCGGTESLYSYVLAHQNTLLIRSTLWAALVSMRSLARSHYHRELRRLWVHPDLRKHVRFLLITFLGQIADPDDEEAQWLLPAVDGALQGKVLVAISGSAGWFRRILSRLPGLLAQDDETHCWQLALVLHRAFRFDGQTVLDLVSQHWETPEKSRFALQVFREVQNWDQRSIGAVNRLIKLAKPDLFYVEHVCESIVTTFPGRAAAMLIDAFDLQRNGQPPSDVLLSHEWHGIEKLSEKAPWIFLKALWPWLKDVLHDSPQRRAQDNEYLRQENWQLEAEIDKIHLIGFWKEMIVQCSVADPREFVRFANAESRTGIMLLHRLLAYGLCKLPASSSGAVVAYLAGDPRRLTLGGSLREVSETEMLLKSIESTIDAASVATMESIIATWNYITADTRSDVKMRRNIAKWNRNSRARLLRLLPSRHLSLGSRRLISEKGIVIEQDQRTPANEFGLVVGSPMSADKMEKASDGAILNCFEELHDGTGADHPRHLLQGGTYQASQVFGEFAKLKPHRAVEIVRQFKAGRQEVPAGHALQSLAKIIHIPAQTVVNLTLELDSAGFSSSDFRECACQALLDSALRSKGLPDGACELMRSWIQPFQSEAILGSKKESSPAAKSRKRTLADAKERPSSLLWGFASGFLPRGNYSLLHAITYGYLRRDPPAADDWLSCFETHLRQSEAFETWQSLLFDLPNLRLVRNPKRVASFVRSLIRKHPQAFSSLGGLYFMAHSHRWLPPDISQTVLNIWRRGKWDQRHQAIGEFALLRYAQVPADKVFERIVKSVFADRNSRTKAVRSLRLGIVYASVNLWAYPQSRALCHRTLGRLASSNDADVIHAFMDVFRVSRSIPPDRATKELLEMLLRRPRMLGEPSMLTMRMKEMVSSGMDLDLVCRVANKILDLDEKGQESHQRRWLADSRELTEISMTLQKIESFQREGLALFERLMDLGTHEASVVLHDLDLKIS